MAYSRPRSNWWFLLPIFLGIIGGIIAYFVLRRDDPRKARNCIYLGLALMAVGIVLNLVGGGAEIADIDMGFEPNV